MCVYCAIADHFWRHDPPFPIHLPYSPASPSVLPSIQIPIDRPAWPLDRLKGLDDILRRVKALEDQLGCPCEPDKLDYLKLIKDRIDALETHVDLPPSAP